MPPMERASGAYVYMEVEDTGSGMSTEVMQRIFEPFFTTKFTGRGLGLSAVMGIARSHGGGVTITSEIGVGTALGVVLPALQAPLPQPVVQSIERPVSHVGGRILIIDDEPTVLGVACMLVKSLGYDVVGFTDGQEAIDAISTQAEPLLAVLLDLTMIGLDGEETRRELLRLRPNLPVILMSGFSEQELQVRFADLGFAGFLQKPFRRDDLISRLREAIHHNVDKSAIV